MSKYTNQSESKGSMRGNNTSVESPNFRNTSNSNMDYGNEDFKIKPSSSKSNKPSQVREPRQGLSQIPSQNQSQYEDNPQKEKVVITIALGNLGEKEIICHLDDDPHILAQNFCIQNSLAKEAANIIVDMINRQMKALLKKNQKKLAAKPAPQESFTFSPTHSKNPSQSNRNENSQIDQPRYSQDRRPEDDILNSKEIQSVQSEYIENKPSISNQKEKLIAKLDIHINPSETRALCLYQGEDPVEAAQEFCYQNNLPENVMDVLVANLKKVLAQYESKKAKKKASILSENESQPRYSEQTAQNDFSAKSQKNQNPKQFDSEPREPRNADNEMAAKYEKWQSLMKEKSKGQIADTNTKPFKIEDKDDFYSQAASSISKPRNRSKSPRASNISKATETFGQPRPTKSKLLTQSEITEMTTRLHDEAKTRAGKIEQAHQEKQQEKLEEESKHLTFQPNADRSKSTEPPLRRYMNIEAERRKKEKLEEARKEALAEECPFQPVLSNRTYEMTRARSKSPIHQRLYEEGLQHEKHMEQWRDMAFNEYYPFKPNLPADIQDHLGKRQELPQKEFIERLIQEKYDKELRLLKKRIEENTGKDPKTGQAWHHPVFKHDKYYWKIKERDDANQTLYLDVENLQVKKKNEIPSRNSIKTLGGFKYIFDKLDSDKDNKISSTLMDVSNLELPLLEVLCDFFNWMDDQKAVLDFSQFCAAIENLNLEDKVMTALEKIKEINPTITNEYLVKYFESVRGQRPNKDDLVFPSKDEVFQTKERNRAKTPTPHSDNKSLNYSKESNKLTKHYQEILSRKSSSKNEDASNSRHS